MLEEPDPQIEDKLRSLPESQQWFYDAISAANHGRSVAPIHPGLMTSTDDTTSYAVAGNWSQPETLRLVHEEGYDNRGAHSLHHHKKASMFTGMRFRQTHTMAVIGTCAQVLVTVSSLTKEEMPKKEFILEKIEGMCPSGNGVSVGNKGYDWLLFIRGGKGNDVEQFNIYRDYIALPFIKQSRETYFRGYNSSAGGPIREQSCFQTVTCRKSRALTPMMMSGMTTTF